MAGNLMIQGTMSNAGKSIITAGILRVLAQDGYKVAPFKSQNMALNSFVTKDGREMGRAQVMQAEAAGIAPEIAMNPILLKPTSDVGSQVILQGDVIGNMTANEYFQKKQEFIPQIMESYEYLKSRYDFVVIEGAGSPAEINLKSHDIVNMGLAELVDAPVLMVGDIDRGGVFAQLYGTIALLKEEERRRVKGLIINKFRGDKTILDPGITMICEKTGLPMTGVIPFGKFDVEDEDSLSTRLESRKRQAEIHIAIIRFPHISNFTDYDVLERYSNMNLFYTQKPEELAGVDLIILPGTKNTIGDLIWLRETGLEAEILKSRERGSLVFGICGGFQMLGEELKDPCRVEQGGKIRGMGMLPLCTTFVPKKVRTQVKGSIKNAKDAFSALNGALYEGYEIHMGFTKFISDAKRPGADAYISYSKGTCMGTYIHGFFDSVSVQKKMLNLLFQRKGKTFAHSIPDQKTYKETQYDLLADLIREHVDMEQIYGILKG